MTDRRLRQAAQFAVQQHTTNGGDDIDSLLTAMGGTARAAMPVWKPRYTGVGEAVWEPAINATQLPKSSAAASAPSTALEMRRGKAMRQLQAGIEKALLSVLGASLLSGLELMSSVTLRNGNGLVERWAMCRHAAAKRASIATDPLLPPAGMAGGDDAGLLDDLRSAGVSEDKAAEVAAVMSLEASHALNWLRRQRDERQNTNASVREKPSDDAVARAAATARRLASGQSAKAAPPPPMLEVRVGKTSLSLSATHRDKLLELYCRVAGRQVAADDAGFARALFCVLARYEAIGGAGHQAALNSGAFTLLRTHFGCEFECFASPLNCRYSRFCSAFPDVDAPFGSCGDFFSCAFTEGSYEANPPFVPYLIDVMAARMNQQLGAAEKAGRALAFVVIVPNWRAEKASGSLTASPYARRALVAANRQHSYHEGAQHRRPPNKLRVSTCDTSVFFLQTSAAAAKWPTTDEACDALLDALSGGAHGETARPAPSAVAPAITPEPAAKALPPEAAPSPFAPAESLYGAMLKRRRHAPDDMAPKRRRRETAVSQSLRRSVSMALF